MADLIERLRAAAKFGGHYSDAADEIERLVALVEELEAEVRTINDPDRKELHKRNFDRRTTDKLRKVAP